MKRLSFVVIVATIIVSGFVLLKQQGKGRVKGVADFQPVNIQGLVLPHHELAQPIIIDSLEKISRSNNFEEIIVLGPNHFYPESPKILTSTNLKNYNIDSDFIENLVSLNYVKLAEKIVDNEHSVGVPIKYLSFVFPHAKFVPLVISPHYDNEFIDNIANYLVDKTPEKTLFVLSCDFAHNATMDEGLEANKQTISTLSSFDYDKLLSYGDEHLDSPIAAAIFLKVMEKLGARDWNTLYSAHGAMFDNVADLKGTSYVIGTFSLPEDDR